MIRELAMQAGEERLSSFVCEAFEEFSRKIRRWPQCSRICSTYA